MTKKIKVMHIINNLEVGGAEKILVLLANELAKNDNVEVYIVSLEGHGYLVNEISNSVHLKQFKYKLFSNPIKNRFDPYFRPGLFSYVKKINPDIIHGHLIKGEDFAKVLGMLLHKPVVTTVHDILFIPRKSTKLLNKYVSRFIAVSRVVKEHIEKYFEVSSDKISIIPNAIKTDSFIDSTKKFNKSKPTFIFIGRLLKSKGVDDAIKGLAMLRKEYPNIEFLIYGKPVFESYQEYLDNLVRTNNYDFVKFMGRTDNVPEALKNGDIFILPSQSEGFAISVLEAAASSKPVIATRVGAIEDIVESDKSGILVDWHSPKQIYKAAKKILDNNLVEKYGARARKIAEKSFDIKKVADMYYGLYQDVCNIKRNK